jgi:hypothetical protein
MKLKMSTEKDSLSSWTELKESEWKNFQFLCVCLYVCGEEKRIIQKVAAKYDTEEI